MKDSATAKDVHGELPSVFNRLARKAKGNKPLSFREKKEAKPPPPPQKKHKFLQKGEKTKNLPYGAPIRPRNAHQGGGGGGSSS